MAQDSLKLQRMFETYKCQNRLINFCSKLKFWKNTDWSFFDWRERLDGFKRVAVGLQSFSKLIKALRNFKVFYIVQQDFSIVRDPINTETKREEKLKTIQNLSLFPSPSLPPITPTLSL
jgi:hypothetical protein